MSETSWRSPLHVNAATGGAAIIPSDSAAVDFNGFYVGGAGNVKVDLYDGSTITLTGVLVGVIYPMKVSKVYATGTTATNLVGLKW
jgi:Mn-containing catalase